MFWHVIYTKPKNELKVASRIQKLGIEVYCPTRTEIRQWSDRQKKITTPLFSCYVFVKVNDKNRNRVFEVPGVVSFLYWLGKYAMVKDSELAAIRSWNDCDGAISLWTEDLTPGDRVYIANGAFMNNEAIVKEIGNNQMRLLLPSLGFSVCVTTSTSLKRIE